MKLFNKLFHRIFSPDCLLKPEARLGEIPGSGELYGSFFRVAWPSMLESAASALTGFVDTMMVSSISSAAISTVGLTTQPRLLFFAIFSSLNAGMIAVVSRKKGKGDREGANRVMHTGLSVCLLLSVLAFVVAYLVSIPLLRFAGAVGENAVLLEDARIYFLITVGGVCINAFGLAINAAQRACSNTAIALRTSLISNVVNIIFNYLLINGKFGFPRLEVTGAAIATLLGNIAACLWSILSVTGKHSYLRLRLRSLFRFDRSFLSMIGRVSAGAGAEQLFMRVGFFLFAKIVAQLGTNEFATHQICMTIITLSFAFGDGLGVAGSAFVGQNLGADRPDLSELYAKAARRVGLCISVVVAALFWFGGDFLISLFSDEEEIVQLGGKIMKIIAIVATMQIEQTIYTGCLRGAGDTRYTAVISFCSIGAIRPALSYLLCYPLGLGVIGAWIALLLDQATRYVASTLRFASGKWKTIRLG